MAGMPTYLLYFPGVRVLLRFTVVSYAPPAGATVCKVRRTVAVSPHGGVSWSSTGLLSKRVSRNPFREARFHPAFCSFQLPSLSSPTSVLLPPPQRPPLVPAFTSYYPASVSDTIPHSFEVVFFPRILFPQK